MLGSIRLDDLKTLEELDEISNPFERVDYKIRTIMTKFGKESDASNKINRQYYKGLGLDIIYTEYIVDDKLNYTIKIRSTNDDKKVLYDSLDKKYDNSNWESTLNTIFDLSYKVIEDNGNYMKSLKKNG